MFGSIHDKKTKSVQIEREKGPNQLVERNVGNFLDVYSDENQIKKTSMIFYQVMMNIYMMNIYMMNIYMIMINTNSCNLINFIIISVLPKYYYILY